MAATTSSANKDLEERIRTLFVEPYSRDYGGNPRLVIAIRPEGMLTVIVVSGIEVLSFKGTFRRLASEFGPRLLRYIVFVQPAHGSLLPGTGVEIQLFSESGLSSGARLSQVREIQLRESMDELTAAPDKMEERARTGCRDAYLGLRREPPPMLRASGISLDQRAALLGLEQAIVYWGPLMPTAYETTYMYDAVHKRHFLAVAGLHALPSSMLNYLMAMPHTGVTDIDFDFAQGVARVWFAITDEVRAAVTAAASAATAAAACAAGTAARSPVRRAPKTPRAGGSLLSRAVGAVASVFGGGAKRPREEPSDDGSDSSGPNAPHPAKRRRLLDTA